MTQPALKRLEEFAGTIAAARALVSDGNLVDLGGIERQAEELCQSIRKLPQDEARRALPPLTAALDELDRLTGDLTAQHRELSEALGRLADHDRASAAYSAPIAALNEPRK